MQRKIGLGLLLALVCTLQFLQAGAVQAVTSHAVFYKPSVTGGDSAAIEVYWQINALSLHYTRVAGDSIRASVRTELRVVRVNDGVEVAGARYVLSTRPVPVQETANQTILEGKRFNVPQGDYRVELLLSDLQNPKADYNYADSVSATAELAPFYSTLQLLDTAFQNSSPSPFLRNGRQQFPNTSGFLDEGRLTLHSYFELYHTETLPAKAFPLRQITFLSNKASETPLPQCQVTDTILTGVVRQVFLHDFNTEALSSGNYYLRTTLRDKDGNVIASNKTFYQSINKHPKSVEISTAKAGVADTQKVPVEQVSIFDLSKTFISKYNPSQLRAMLKMINPVATADEQISIQAFLKKQDEMYTRYFLYNFFLKRNSKDPGQAWKAYADTVRQANRQFSAGSTQGYETDRGGIFMRYGKPLERVPVPNENGALPYEIWTYNNLGGKSELAVFLFYQPGFASGNMILLHSTVAGEVRNPAWRTLLFRNSMGSTENSQAEQYLGSR